jgi:protein TonB
MEIKKNPKQRLEKYSKIFTEIGLVLVLFIVYQLLEHKTYERNISDSLGEVAMIDDVKEDVPIVERQEVVVPKDVPPPPVPEKIQVIEDDLEIEETVLADTETDETESVQANFDIPIVEAEEEEEVVEDVPFLVIENAPIYPGCKGDKKQLKDCFTKKITEFFVKRFDGDLAKELGLAPGKKRIIVLFRIDTKGEVTDIRARAPHPKIQEEVMGIIGKLPQMTPGNQRGKPVRVQYTLPITFHVKN